LALKIEEFILFFARIALSSQQINKTDNMKKIFLFVGLLCACMGAKADTIQVKTFGYAGPFAVQKPYFVDSVDVKSHKFADGDLLKSDVALNDVQKGRTFSAAVMPSTQGYALQLFGFKLTNSCFGETEIKVSTTAPYELYVDGQKTDAGKMKLAPATHEVVLKCLSRPSKTDSLRVTVAGDGVQTGVTGSKRLYSLADVMDGTRFGGVEVSPSGKWLIVRYRTTRTGGRTDYSSRIVDVATHKTLLDTQEQISWMPRTDRYYYTKRSNDGLRLLSVDPVTNNVQTLSDNLPEGSFSIAPTGDFLVFTNSEEGKAEDPDIYQVLTPDDRQPGWRTRYYLSLYDLHTGTLRRLTYGNHSTFLADISQDGRKLLFTVSDTRLTQRPFELQSIYSMDVASGRVDTLIYRGEFLSQASFSPDAKQLVVMGNPEAFDGIGAKVKPGQTPSMVENELFLYRLADKHITPLTRDFDPSVMQVQWNPRDGQIYFTAENRDYVSLYTLNPSNGRIVPMNAKEDVVASFSVAEKAPVMAYYGQSASNSDRLYVCSTSSRKSTCVEDLSATILKDVELGECRDWNFVSSRGDTIYGRYYLPPHFDPSKQYPMVVNYYGGCSPTSRVLESRYPQHLYAAEGYVMYVLQPSGATGFGQEFAARHVNTFGDYVADDIIEGTKKFCEAHPFVNSKKIGCIGASYGGFMTDYLCTKTDIFAAAISHAGISNQASYWGFGYWGYSYSEVSAANSYPWNNPQLYTDHSPLFHADKVHTPLLFLHGSVDTNVPIAESTQMFTALKLLGRETAFVVVEGQNHHILDYGKRVKWQNTIFAWFDRWLKNEPQWWESLYPKKDLE
jgi:dipeptidyl aminopeptidase/acylaminoacyl peptidase